MNKEDSSKTVKERNFSPEAIAYLDELKKKAQEFHASMKPVTWQQARDQYLRNK